MDEALYFLFQVLLIGLVIGLLTSLYLGLRHALRQLGIDAKHVKKYLQYSLLGLICWLLFLAGMAAIGFFQDFEVLPPRVFLAFLPPFLDF